MGFIFTAAQQEMYYSEVPVGTCESEYCVAEAFGMQQKIFQLLKCRASEMANKYVTIHINFAMTNCSFLNSLHCFHPLLI